MTTKAERLAKMLDAERLVRVRLMAKQWEII